MEYPQEVSFSGFFYIKPKTLLSTSLLTSLSSRQLLGRDQVDSVLGWYLFYHSKPWMASLSIATGRGRISFIFRPWSVLLVLLRVYKYILLFYHSLSRHTLIVSFLLPIHYSNNFSPLCFISKDLQILPLEFTDMKTIIIFWPGK